MSTSAPDDFAHYWGSIDDHLDSVDPAPEFVHVPSQSTDFATSWHVRFTSTGPSRLFGFLSIPKGDGPFPGLLHTPRYGSVVKPGHFYERQRYVVFVPAHRGQRLADSPWAAPYPGLLTEGIDSPGNYIYRSIAADTLRAAELFLNLPEVDTTRVGVAGDDLALIVAARRSGISSVAITGMMFRDAITRAGKTAGYPIEEINDYLRFAPQHADQVAQSLSYFDPIHHAAQISAATFFVEDDPGTIGGPEWIDPLTELLSGPSERYRVTHEGATDRDAVDAWLATRLGVPPHPQMWSEAM